MARRFSTSQGIWYGLLLLGEVTGILITSTLAGLILDKLWHYDPIGLGIGVIVGSLASTGLVLRKVTTEIENG